MQLGNVISHSLPLLASRNLLGFHFTRLRSHRLFRPLTISDMSGETRRDRDPAKLTLIFLRSKLNLTCIGFAKSLDASLRESLSEASSAASLTTLPMSLPSVLMKQLTPRDSISVHKLRLRSVLVCTLLQVDAVNSEVNDTSFASEA